MKVKSLSRADLTDLKMCSAALSNLPGTGRVVATDDAMFLGLHGNGSIVIDIKSETANLIWEMMGLPKDDSNSAYNDVMASGALQLHCDIYKAGTLFSTFYFANAAIFFDNSKQVKFGSVAAKQISTLIEMIRKLLMGQEPMAETTEEAIARMD